METKRFPNRLKQFRDIVGLTKKDVSFMLGFKNANRITRWERGDASPGIAHLVRLSLIYGVLINELYFDLLQEAKKDIASKRELLFLGRR